MDINVDYFGQAWLCCVSVGGFLLCTIIAQAEDIFFVVAQTLKSLVCSLSGSLSLYLDQSVQGPSVMTLKEKHLECLKRTRKQSIDAQSNEEKKTFFRMTLPQQTLQRFPWRWSPWATPIVFHFLRPGGHCLVD